MSFAASGLVGNMYECDYHSDSYLQINNCGIMRMNGDRDTLTNSNIRQDYKLLYMWDGKITSRINGESLILQSGDIIFHRPGEILQYQFPYGISSTHYWLHFTGTIVESLLQQCGIPDSKPFSIGQSREICDLLYKIILEIQSGNTGSPILCNGFFLEVMGFFHRLTAPQEAGAEELDTAKIQPALQEIASFFYENRPMSYYAQLCQLSTSRFTYLFSSSMHITPQAYITSMRMEQARHLLAHSTSMSIEEVARAIGYQDPLYFSRVFRKATGLSPSLYRKGAAT